MKWKLGNLSGIGVYIHWSFWILPLYILLTASGSPAGAAYSVGLVFAVFGCIVLHELGHALMARRYGIGTRDITLYPIGGVARLERMPTRPVQELAIALAGPAVNVVIAAALFMGLAVMSSPAAVLALLGGSFLVSLMWINVALVIFNLLPAFPMDGGRVLRAFLAMSMPYLTATQIAARVGQGVAILLGLVGLMTGGTLILVAIFVFLAAQAELNMARMRQASPPPFWIGPTAQGSTMQASGSADDIVWLTDVRIVPDEYGRPRVIRSLRPRSLS